jgi:uncharacterized phiE125 gp8 family phage protein
MANNSNIWYGGDPLRDVDNGTNAGLTLGVVTPSAVQPITVAEFKTYANVHVSSDDALIGAIIDAVKNYGQDFTRTTWFTTVYDAQWESYGASVDLPMGPHISIQSVTRVYPDGSELVLGADDYLVSGVDFKTLKFYDWGYGLKVRFTAGYGASASALPSDLRLGVYKACLSAYEDRQNLAEGGFTELPGGSKGYFSGKRRVIL